VKKGSAVAMIDARYGGSADPVVAFRDALRSDPTGVEAAKDAWVAWLRQRGAPSTWLRRMSVTDPACGDLRFVDGPYEDVLAVPRVYGTIDDPHEGVPVTIPVAGGRYWCVQDAKVVGGWDVVTTASGACWPALDPGTESLLVSNALDARLLGWTPSSMVVRDGAAGQHRHVGSFARISRRRVDTAIALVGEHSFQFGHWLIDYLGRALSVRHLDEAIPVLIDSAVPQNARWWLERVLPGRRVLALERQEEIAVDLLIVPLQRTFCPPGWVASFDFGPEVWLWDSRAIAELQKLTSAAGPAVRRHRRLFLARRPERNKPLVNQSELAAAVADDGFEVVYPEDVPMPALRALLDETEQVIAPTGSQLKNLVAARAGLRVLVLAGGAMGKLRAETMHYGRVCGHQVALLGGFDVGPSHGNPYARRLMPYKIDAGLFEAARRDFFQGNGPGQGRAVASAPPRDKEWL
jgi:hypothetical protein